MALLQGPQLLATSHGHDDPAPGLLLVSELLTAKLLCSTLEGRFPFYPLVSSHFRWPRESPNESFFIQPGSSPQSNCYCCAVCCLITFVLNELKLSREEDERHDSPELVSVRRRYLRTNAFRCVRSHLEFVHIWSLLVLKFKQTTIFHFPGDLRCNNMEDLSSSEWKAAITEQH